IGFDEGTVEILAIGEGKAVDDGVERLTKRGERSGEAGQLILLGDVAGNDGRYVEVLGEFFDGLFLALAEIGESDCGAFAGEGLRDGVGETPAVRDTEDEGEFALEQFGHEASSVKRRRGRKGQRVWSGARDESAESP